MTRSVGALARSAAGSALVGYVALQALGRWAGSTADERAAALPGDELVADPQLVTDHATTIAVPPEQVWPWLTQMGWHLGGYYTPAWVDLLLFPANWPSLDRLDPALQRDLLPGRDPRRPAGHRRVRGRPRRGAAGAGAAVHHARPAGVGRQVRRPDRLDLVPAPAIDVRRWHAAAPAGARPDVPALVRGALPRHHHARRLRDGDRDAARDQGAGRCRARPAGRLSGCRRGR